MLPLPEEKDGDARVQVRCSSLLLSSSLLSSLSIGNCLCKPPAGLPQGKADTVIFFVPNKVVPLTLKAKGSSECGKRFLFLISCFNFFRLAPSLRGTKARTMSLISE